LKKDQEKEKKKGLREEPSVSQGERSNRKKPFIIATKNRKQGIRGGAKKGESQKRVEKSQREKGKTGTPTFQQQ